MTSTTYFIIFIGFFITILQLVTSNEWNVERSSVNPLSYTEEDRYSFHWPTESPLSSFFQKRTQCPENEHFSLVDALCQQTCDNYNKPIPCRKLRMWGCICDSGLVRGPDKKCIKPEECPNKQESEAQHLATENLQFQETENPSQLEVENHATAQPSYWTLPTIPSLICSWNEVLTPCPSSCQDDCNNFREKDRECIRICIPSCVCKKGFVRSHDGKCIKPYECPQEKNFCPSGEKYSPCHSHCEENCMQGEDHKNSCEKESRLCVPGCTCKAGLVRGPNGTCIYRSECPTTPPQEPPTKVCPENELYEQCEAACQRNCSNIDSGVPCPRICQPGCVCKEPMVRGKYGKCVETDECPKDETASDIFVTLNPPPYTDDDYTIPESMRTISEKENHLILETENPPFEQTEIPPLLNSKRSSHCPPLEKWVVCGGHCERNCSNKDEKDFICKPVCIPGCICEQELVRGPNGKCIRKDECPAESDKKGERFHFPTIICGRNEHLDLTPSSCPDDCNNYKDTGRKCGKNFLPKCICKKGFVRGPNGNCIKSSECPEKKDTCRPDEIYSTRHGNCESNCTNWLFNLVCPKEEVAGCVCHPGLIRGPGGKCIIWFQCPKPQTNSIIYPEESPSAPMESTGIN